MLSVLGVAGVTAIPGVLTVRALAAGGQGFLGPLPWLSHLPFGFVIGLSVVTNAIWQVLAFAGGYLVASQHRSSEELVRVNADLVATQQLLTESTTSRPGLGTAST